ncbi:hypothetical protein [Streptomyces sp. NRRL F-5135]|uniref:hypothetical protein n=1 Tax=Streptomyces sp. NRRL F-5135 TaxID=1463858 RepID=UPI0004C4AC35|nr:hypothetical protein [Streptomyces sp. NRRL F-5135]
MGGQRTRNARPVALMSAVATLCAAFLFCLSPGSGAVPGRAGTHHDAAGIRSGASGTDASSTVRAVAGDGGGRSANESRYVCPYDRGDCGRFAHLSPAVLTAPPPAAPQAATVTLTHLEPPYRTGPLPRSGALARAPDLHVLQVLRT